MSFDEAPTDGDPVVINTINLIRLCSRMFKDYRAEYKLTNEQATQVDSMSFLNWFRQRQLTISSGEIQVYCDEAHVGADTWEMFEHILGDQMGANTLAGIWPQVVFDFRGKPAVEVDSIHQIVLIKWKDGRVAPLSSLITRELASDDMTFNDGVLATLVQVTAHSLGKAAGDIGLNQMHDDRSQWAPDNAYEVLMGLIIKILQGAVIIDPTSGQHVKLDAKLAGPCQNVMRTLQAMFRPPIPPAIKAKIMQRREAAGQGNVGQVGEGGWDPG